MNYVHQLEQQNDELKNKLADCEDKLFRSLEINEFLTPRWKERICPVRQDYKSTNEGIYYEYITPVSLIAKVIWDIHHEKWKIDLFCEGFHIVMTFFEKVEDAKLCVEKHYSQGMNETYYHTYKK